MKFIPYDRFDLASSHQKHELIQRLAQHIAEPRFFRFSRPVKSYQGRVDGDGFSVSPVTWYQNSFKPVIKGRFEQHPSGTRICVTQRLHAFVAAFLMLWLVGVIMISVFVVFAAQAPLQQRLFPFLMLALGWALVTGSFWWEARRTKRDLMRILDVEAAAT